MNRHLFWLALVAATFCTPTIADDNRNDSPVNFVFFIADDVNKEYYGCYGHEDSPAPALSKFAKQGMVFDQMFTGQAICAPSRSMAYTGKYPLRNGAFQNHTRVYQDTKSVCHYMSELNYDVILCGKSHVGPKDSFPWTIEMKSVEPTANTDRLTRPALPAGQLETYFQSRAKDARTEDGARPFCIMATSYYPHGERPKGTTFEADQIKLAKSKSDSPGNRQAEAQFYQAIKNSDDEFAQVLHLLDKYGLAENTVVMFASDHGRSGKFTVYDRGLNVPFVVRWPGVVPAGSRTDALASFADILPTIVDVAGGTTTKDFDGKSFQAVLRGQTEKHHDYVYGVMTNQGIINAHVFPGRMIRSDKFKYIHNFNAMEVVQRKLAAGERLNPFLKLGADRHPNVPEEELYRVDDDPNEKTNLAADPKFAKVKSQLKAQLQTWLVEQQDFLAQPGNMPLLHSADTFRLDQKHPRSKQQVPAELKGTLKRSSLYRHTPKR